MSDNHLKSNPAPSSQGNPPDSSANAAKEKNGAPKKTGPKWYHRPVPIIVIAVLMGLLVFFGTLYLIFSHNHESTDDAFIQADTVNLATRVAGQVQALQVTDNQLVKKGDLLLELDPRDLEAALAEKAAALQAAKTRQTSAQNNYKLAQSRVKSSHATVAQRVAEAESDKALADRAAKDLTRNRELLESKTISPQEYDAARATAQSTQAKYEATLQQVAAAESGVAEAEDQSSTASAEITTAGAQIKQAAADLEAAQLNLSYGKIYSVVDARVTHRAVNVGDYLQVGQNLMALVPTNVYVMANFKETQLRLMQPGQPAVISVDAYEKTKYKGHVDSIQAGSGANFSLLPPENAVGNFVKVVQRVPVKIVFDEPLNTNQVVGPGMSVLPEVTVATFQFSNLVLLLIAVLVSVLILVLGFYWAARAKNQPEEKPPEEPEKNKTEAKSGDENQGEGEGQQDGKEKDDGKTDAKMNGLKYQEAIAKTEQAIAKAEQALARADQAEAKAEQAKAGISRK